MTTGIAKVRYITDRFKSGPRKGKIKPRGYQPIFKFARLLKQQGAAFTMTGLKENGETYAIFNYTA